MGDTRHHAIIVTSWDEPRIVDVHRAAQAIFSPPFGLGYGGIWVSPLSPKSVNGHRSFFVAPDGSQEGWDASEVGETRRDGFVALLRGNCYEDGSNALAWAEVQYGDYACESMVTRGSDADERVAFGAVSAEGKEDVC